jgi:hypothetical protein
MRVRRLVNKRSSSRRFCSVLSGVDAAESACFLGHWMSVRRNIIEEQFVRFQAGHPRQEDKTFMPGAILQHLPRLS